ncbi:putative G-protein coupled receptor 112 [Trichonephila inaurata madagascariensis]|uniref:Putative G-protein coupled receptor 112 n=1 Tax=Trichonephila inaurata madagascariensis TaxID=2747483 RepID=A0A8X6WNV6_9ARAC|nr:putative G-protein coupled receptor 112 [Trichonephila inaurata madagascariensis]
MVKNGSSVDDSEEVQITNGPIGFGRAVDFTANNNESSKFCLKIHVVPKNKADESCWDNPQNCDKGMSVSIWLKVTFYRNDDEKRFVFSTGADGEGTPGVALYFKGIYLYAVVSTGDDMWTLTVPGPVKNNTWNELGIRWSRDIGLDMFVNAEMSGQVRYPDPVDPPTSRDFPMETTVGCLKKGDGNYDHFAYGEFDELTAWMWALNGSDTQFFLGGHDPNTTCDVETHPLRCETNMEMIMKNMVSDFLYTGSLLQQK